MIFKILDLTALHEKYLVLPLRQKFRSGLSAIHKRIQGKYHAGLPGYRWDGRAYTYYTCR